MLIEKTFYDIPTKLHSEGHNIRIFVIAPVTPDYPQAKFPGLRHINFQSAQLIAN